MFNGTKSLPEKKRFILGEGRFRNVRDCRIILYVKVIFFNLHLYEENMKINEHFSSKSLVERRTPYLFEMKIRGKSSISFVCLSI